MDPSQDMSAADDAHVERLGNALQGQVERLVQALRVSTTAERQQAIERIQEDCSRVKGDLSQTQGIQHYLGSLLEETDPFLLIWVRLHADERRMWNGVNEGRN